jgi:hypothetical protein
MEKLKNSVSSKTAPIAQSTVGGGGEPDAAAADPLANFSAKGRLGMEVKEAMEKKMPVGSLYGLQEIFVCSFLFLCGIEHNHHKNFFFVWDMQLLQVPEDVVAQLLLLTMLHLEEYGTHNPQQ